MITKLRLDPQINVLRFDKKSFFNKILGFTPYWDYKSFGKEYYGEKNRNLIVITKFHLKCGCIDGSLLNGVRQQTLFNFLLD